MFKGDPRASVPCGCCIPEFRIPGTTLDIILDTDTHMHIGFFQVGHSHFPGDHRVILEPNTILALLRRVGLYFKVRKPNPSAMGPPGFVTI